MEIVIFGLTISSSWGNGHATLWRGLCRALAAASHHVTFFERDAPYYRSTRDLHTLTAGTLDIYESWEEVQRRAERAVADADAVIVTSYCPDGVAATELAWRAARPLSIFYDMDTPVSLDLLERGERPPYISDEGLERFDLVLSFTGGPALELLSSRLGARHVAPLHGHVDERIHHPVPATDAFRCELSYLGTFSPDRHARVQELLFEPARCLTERRFLLAGAQYPKAEQLPSNLAHLQHLAPADHPALFCSSRATLNVTRDVMRRLGHCPSGRLFEAAACGAVLLSDWFDGLDAFFEPGREIEVVETRQDVLRLLSLSDAELRARGARARERVLAEHTAARRARELERLLASARERLGRGRAPLQAQPIVEA